MNGTKSAATAARCQQKLERETFTTSRELEYFTESELIIQTGYPRDHWWPEVIVKELLDNSLDACEQAGVAPEISIRFTGNEISVSDNGPGIAPAVVEKVLDYATRTSDKAAYVSPTRGAQGNALKTVMAIPYVLNDSRDGLVEIEACGIQHRIKVSTDQVAQQVRIDHQTTEFVKTGGTVVRVALDTACSEGSESKSGILQKLVGDYALFNPHARFELVDQEAKIEIAPTAPDWRKWFPSDPTSAYWYDPDRLAGLIGCYVSAERNGGTVRTVRDFVSEFRGLSATAKQKQVAATAGLERAYLHDLTPEGKFDWDHISALLAVMKEASKPVKPEALGILGEAHFRKRLEPEGKTFRYSKASGTDRRGLPFLIETAFAVPGAPKPDQPGKIITMAKSLRVGLNWAVPLGNPFQNDAFEVDGQNVVTGMAALLSEQHISMYSDQVMLAIHIATPRFQFVDRGKGAVSLGGRQ